MGCRFDPYWGYNMENMKEYLYNEWRRTIHPKYIKYFDEWFNNLTETQKLYFEVYSKGLKTPF